MCAGEWRSLVARLLWEQDAAGSNPVSPMRLKVSPQLTPPPLRKGRFFIAYVRVRGQRVVSAPSESSAHESCVVSLLTAKGGFTTLFPSKAESLGFSVLA